MGKYKVKSDPRKIALSFQVAADIESNIIQTFTVMGDANPAVDSNFGLDSDAVEPSALGPIIEQLPFDDQCTLGVGAVTTLSPVATKMVGLHINCEIEVANLPSTNADGGQSLPWSASSIPPGPAPSAVPELTQAAVVVELYQVQVSQSPVTQTYAGLQPNRFSPMYSPERKLLLSFNGIVSVMPGTNSQKMTISEHTQIGRNFEKGDGIGMVVISRSANGSYVKQVPLTVNGGLTFWLQN